jgi:hypothetical protein
MNRSEEDKTEESFGSRPAHWDRIYGPHGQPENYTPPGTAMTSVQSTKGLRILSVIMVVFALGFLWLFIQTLNGDISDSDSSRLYVMCPILIILSLAMSVWGLKLANKRSKWIESKK